MTITELPPIMLINDGGMSKYLFVKKNNTHRYKVYREKNKDNYDEYMTYFDAERISNNLKNTRWKIID